MLSIGYLLLKNILDFVLGMPRIEFLPTYFRDVIGPKWLKSEASFFKREFLATCRRDGIGPKWVKSEASFFRVTCPSFW